MSEQEVQLREQADAARKAHDYKKGVELFDQLLKLVYKEGDELPALICRDFIHYAECLLYMQDKKNPCEEDLEVAWECLEKAKIGYEAMPQEEAKFIGLIDVHDLLGEITLSNGNYPEAAEQFKISSEIGLAHSELSWRLPLNSLYCRSNALIYAREIAGAIPVIEEALKFIETNLAKEGVSENDKKDLEDFKKELSFKLGKLREAHH